MKVLVTGSAGFIGSALSLRLLERGDEVIGVDNLNDYYDVNLKKARLARTQDHPCYTDLRVDIEDGARLHEAFVTHRPERVVNLAAQAGVRYSIENPMAYVNTNLVGFANILEACRHNGVEHLVYASSSSVYGANTEMPFSVHHNVDHPLSLYAASKKANELMAHTYSHLYQLPTTGLRFFTVYGPWGRPDMALFKFTRAILAGEPIPVFNYGKHRRDFTYIDDIVEGVIRVLDRVPDGQCRLVGRPSRCRNQPGALSALQHRQQLAGGADGIHQPSGAVLGEKGGDGDAAAAAGRCARYLRRRHRPGSGHRLSPGHPGVGGGCPVRRLVSGVLSGLMDPEMDFRSRSLSDARAPCHLAGVSLSSHHFHASRGMVTRSISFIPQCRF